MKKIMRVIRMLSTIIDMKTRNKNIEGHRKDIISVPIKI